MAIVRAVTTTPSHVKMAKKTRSAAVTTATELLETGSKRARTRPAQRASQLKQRYTSVKKGSSSVEDVAARTAAWHITVR